MVNVISFNGDPEAPWRGAGAPRFLKTGRFFHPGTVLPPTLLDFAYQFSTSLYAINFVFFSMGPPQKNVAQNKLLRPNIQFSFRHDRACGSRDQRLQVPRKDRRGRLLTGLQGLPREVPADLLREGHEIRPGREKLDALPLRDGQPREPGPRQHHPPLQLLQG